MSHKNFLADYCPLQYDIVDLNAGKENKEVENEIVFFSLSVDEVLEKSEGGLFNGVLNSDFIITKAMENGLSAFQCIVMLVKSTFEDHVNLTKEMSGDDLGEKGTYLADLSKCKALSLVFDFYSQAEMYIEGLRFGWNQIVKRYRIKEDICFDSLLSFILANELFKFPVTVLGAYDVSKFAGLDDNLKTFYLRQYELSLTFLQLLGNYHLVERVNKMYEERFRDLAVKIRTKEMTLGQLDIKLRLAHDPAIKNGKELEIKYFEFLVSSRERSDQNRGSFRIKEFSAIAGGDASQHFATYRLKQLYRTISRNCREAFLNSEKDVSADLTKLFIEASNIYNESRLAERDYFIHYYSLINLLGKAIMYRRNHEMELKFNDFTGMKGGQTLPRIRREFIIKTRREVDEVLLRVKSSEDLSFKIKNVCDEELAFLHQNHLERQIEFLDGCIQEVLKEIKACIEAKVSQNEKNQRNIKN